MTFALDLSAFAKKTDERLNLYVKRIVLDVAKELVEMSPVGDPSYWKYPPPPGYVGGRFKGNWDYGVNAAPTTEHDVVDTSGSISLGRIESGMVGSKMAGNVHYLANNVPYAMRLEEGWSWHQAPHGMVEITIIKFQSIVAAAAAEMK